MGLDVYTLTNDNATVQDYGDLTRIPYQPRDRCASRVFTRRGVSSLVGAPLAAARPQDIRHKNASHFPMVEKWEAVRANGSYRMVYAAS